MQLEAKRESLRLAVANLGRNLLTLPIDKRYDKLIEIGFTAATIDTISSGHPDAAEIKEETDSLVDRAESMVRASIDHDAMEVSLPSRTRRVARSHRI